MPGFSPLVSQLLYNRGINTPEQIEPFYAADSRLAHDPFLLPDMEAAVSRVLRAILGAEKIAIYGDFDADGITATAVLMHGLKQLTPNVIPYLPHRVNEGHGLKIAALEELKREGVSLVISVDCGVTGIPQVSKAKKMGMDVIITDHHTPGEELPEAIAVIDPKRKDSVYPFNELAGVGVSYKLLEGVLTNLGKTELLDEVVDLVAIGTVADLTPLFDESRYLVKRGLQQMNKNTRLGIKTLIETANNSNGTITSETITWTIAPRINTASRLDHALPSYELLTTDSTEQARELAEWLNRKNTERQQMTAQASARARQYVNEAGVTSLLVVGDMDYEAGIAGLVASRLTDEFYRPAAVIKVGKRVSSGSCRSIPDFNIIEALTDCKELFLEYGGHAAAAGFVMLTRNLEELQKRLIAYADVKLEGLDLRPRIDIDAAIRLRDITGKVYQSIRELEPFGQGNRLPVFMSKNVRVVNCRAMGASGDHLRLKVEQDGSLWDCVAFNAGENISEIENYIDIAYNLELDTWNGNSTLRLNLIDFHKAQG